MLTGAQELSSSPRHPRLLRPWRQPPRAFRCGKRKSGDNSRCEPIAHFGEAQGEVRLRKLRDHVPLERLVVGERGFAVGRPEKDRQGATADVKLSYRRSAGLKMLVSRRTRERARITCRSRPSFGSCCLQQLPRERKQSLLDIPRSGGVGGSSRGMRSWISTRQPRTKTCSTTSRNRFCRCSKSRSSAAAPTCAENPAIRSRRVF